MGGLSAVGVGLSVTFSLFAMAVVLELYFVWRGRQRRRMIETSPSSCQVTVHGVGAATADVPSERASTSAVCLAMAKNSVDWAAQRTRETKDWVKTGLLCLPTAADANENNCHEKNDPSRSEERWLTSCLPLAKRTANYAAETARDQMMMLSSRFSCMSKEGAPAAEHSGVNVSGVTAHSLRAEKCSTACLAMARGSVKWATQTAKDAKDSVKVLSSQISCASTGTTPVCQEECITVHGIDTSAAERELAMEKGNGNWIIRRTKEMKDWVKIQVFRKTGVDTETELANEKSGVGSLESEERAGGEALEQGVDAVGCEDDEEDDIFKMVGLFGHPRFLFTIAEETKEEMEQEEDAKSRGGKGSRKGSRASSELLFLPSSCSSPSPFATPSSTPPFATPSASPASAYHFPFSKLNQQIPHQDPQQIPVTVGMHATALTDCCSSFDQHQARDEMIAEIGFTSTVRFPASCPQALVSQQDMDIAGAHTVSVPPILSSALSVVPRIDASSSSSSASAPSPISSSCPLTEDSSSSLSSSFSSATPGTVSPTTNPQQVSSSPKRQQRNPLTLIFEHPASTPSLAPSHSHSRVYPLSLPSYNSIYCCSNEGTESLWKSSEDRPNFCKFANGYGSNCSSDATGAVEPPSQPSFKIPAFSQPTTPSPFLRHVLRQKQYNRLQAIRAVNT